MSDIKQEMKRGLLWTALDKYSGQIIAILISMVLARLLTPYDYGVVATASVLIGFLSLFTSIGIGPAIIQRDDLSQQDLDNIFTFSIFLGLFIGAVSFCSSWYIADFYENPLLINVIQFLSVGLFIGTINMVPASLMSKHKRFKEMATRNLVFQVVFGCIGIIAAFKGAGIYALVCPPILASFCTFLYNNHFYTVKVSWNFRLEPLKRIFSYSFFVFMSEFINYFSRNLDKLIIGKMISANALGYYEKSYRLMQMPLNNVSSVLYPVMQPVLSELQNDMEEMATKYTKIVGLIATISFPIAVIMFFTAEDIIYVMFGENWLPSVPTFKILSLSIPFMLICNPNGAIYFSCNATKRLFYVTSINTSLTVLGFIIAAYYGGSIEAIAWGWTSVSIIGTINSYYQLYKLVMHQPLMPILKSLFKPTISAALLSVTAFVYNTIGLTLPHLLNLLVKFSIYSLTLFLYLQYTNQFNILDYIKTKVK